MHLQNVEVEMNQTGWPLRSLSVNRIHSSISVHNARVVSNIFIPNRDHDMQNSALEWQPKIPRISFHLKLAPAVLLSFTSPAVCFEIERKAQLSVVKF